MDIHNVRIAGISAGVPLNKVNNKFSSSFTDEEKADLFIKSTGVAERRISSHLCTSDLGFHAAEKLIADLGWDKDSIEGLIFVSQTADYIIPATACILQDRLHLKKTCFATDISLACSGWVYGLSVAASLVSAGNGISMKRILLFAGDAKPRVPTDDPLFGGACSVTAIEFSPSLERPLLFNFGTDGSNYQSIMIPDGGSRNGINQSSFNEYEFDGRKINNLQLKMNGIDVFSFAISTVPENVLSLCERYNVCLEKIDYFIFHQANKLINSAIIKKLQLNREKVPSSLETFGNTSSASIPLTIVTKFNGTIKDDKLFLCSGFGVGLSWGTVLFWSKDLYISKLIEVGDS